LLTRIRWGTINKYSNLSRPIFRFDPPASGGFMVIDMRTRLSHGHLTNHTANMHFHAQQLSRCAKQLCNLLAELQAIDISGLLKEFEATR
jgi:hypothetical protein